MNLAALIANLFGRLGVRPAAAPKPALVVVGAAAPFAPTSYARARLLRQLHACGLVAGEREPDPNTR